MQEVRLPASVGTDGQLYSYPVAVEVPVAQPIGSGHPPIVTQREEEPPEGRTSALRETCRQQEGLEAAE